MQQIEMGIQLGELRAGIRSAHTRVDELRADFREVVVLLLRDRKDGKAHKLPWVQILAYGATAIFSVLGITLPEKIAALLRALMH